VQPEQKIARIALPVPLRHCFDFIVPDTAAIPAVGARVRVPFGRRLLTGMVMDIVDRSDVPAHRLREIDKILDSEPVYSKTLFDWLSWVARYYHHPIGEVLNTALPVALRKGLPLNPEQPRHYRLTHAGNTVEPRLSRAPLQQSIWRKLHSRPSLSADQLSQLGGSWQRALRILMEKGWVETIATPPMPPEAPQGTIELNAEQAHAAESILHALGTYKSFVLFGITGSGKTEVYLKVIREVIARGKQVLILVPEIGLTPQLVQRIEKRIGHALVVLHSELAVGERHRGWAAARDGSAAIVLGTRSAVFTPLLNPGLIVIDEEQDLSFKQQDGLRYHARDIAVFRARQEGIPVVLGSATPSFESMFNVEKKRYDLLRLNARALGAGLPGIDFIDMRRVPVQHGLSRTLIEAISRKLETGEQCLVFINRRGYAPVLYCSDCGWQAQCSRCDTRMVYHKKEHRLRCHHCGLEGVAPARCPQCEAAPIRPLGEGTQRLEEHLQDIFPAAAIVRIDRDSTRRKGELEHKLNQGTSGAADILIGTQLLAKGHHFPNVTLVGIVDADQGLYSVDFRATEFLFQQIIQVAGRAGREYNPGHVLIQTVHPDHSHFELLRSHDYAGFISTAMEERSQAQVPPFTHFALLRAESTKSGMGLSFLDHARKDASTLEHELRSGVQIMEPVPSPMEKRAGRYRAQLLLSAHNRSAMHHLLELLVQRLDVHPLARRVRWSIDVDPMEMY
jgi:primosomal protein N' (replication factor Y)